MPANTSPIFALTPNVNTGLITSSTTANTKSDGTGTIATDIIKCWTAGGNGSFVYSVRISLNATAAATATAATTMRLFISTQSSGATTNANTWLVQEVSVAAQTADQTTTATYYIEIPLNKVINANYTILATTHIVFNASTSAQVVVFGGDF